MALLFGFGLEKYLQRMEERIMAKADEILALQQALDEATNEIASDLARLREDLAGGVSAEKAEEIRAKLQTQVDRLTVLGQDPEDPIPAPEPPPEP